MSYLVLARKLRPAKFQDLIGQEHIWKTLIKAIGTNRVAHAFLFTGPRGTGKTSCARVLTKALNCISPVEHEPCNRCENCREITQGNATDVMEIDAASNRGIEHVRELRESVKFSPAKCTYKTYIIDEVHMLTTESFNALLKTLEEPPAHVKFILATTDHHKIPTTVISRCQRYDFTNISLQAMVKYLKKVAQAESLQLSDSALRLIASHSAGGMRDALTTLDMLLGFGREQIQDDDVAEVLGLNSAKEIDALLKQIVEKNLSGTLDLFHDLVSKGRSLAQLITDLSKSVKDLTLVKSLPAEKIGWHEFLPDQLETYTRLAEKTTNATLQQYFHILLEMEAQVRQSSQAKTCVEMGLFKMCSVESLAGVAEVISLLRGTSLRSKEKSVEPRLPKEEREIPAAKSASPEEEPEMFQSLEYGEGGPAETVQIPKVSGRERSEERNAGQEANVHSSGEATVREEETPYSLQDITVMWKSFLDEMEKRSNEALMSLLRNSVVLEMDRKRLVIGYSNAQVFDDEKKRAIAKAARDFFKVPIKVFYREQNKGLMDSLKVPKDKERAKRKESLREQARSNPKVREILETFPNSRIKEIIVKEEP